MTQFILFLAALSLSLSASANLFSEGNLEKSVAQERLNCIASTVANLKKSGASSLIRVKNLTSPECVKIKTGDQVGLMRVNDSQPVVFLKNGFLFKVSESDVKSLFLSEDSRSKLTEYSGKNTIEKCFGTSEDSLMIEDISLNTQEGQLYAAVVDTAGGGLRYIPTQDVSFKDAKVRELLNRCDEPKVVNKGPHAPVFAE